MISDKIKLFDSHDTGNHLQEKQDDCVLCTSRHMINPSDSDILEIYRGIKDLLLNSQMMPLSSQRRVIRHAYQLVANLDVSLREKLFDEVVHGRTS